jgi:hypothetical protein
VKRYMGGVDIQLHSTLTLAQLEGRAYPYAAAAVGPCWNIVVVLACSMSVGECECECDLSSGCCEDEK